MICRACTTAADIAAGRWDVAAVRARSPLPNDLELVDRQTGATRFVPADQVGHGNCRGRSWCDCQHAQLTRARPGDSMTPDRPCPDHAGGRGLPVSGAAGGDAA